MFGEDPVHEFTKSLSPLTAFENRTVGPRHPDNISIACRPED